MSTILPKKVVVRIAPGHVFQIGTAYGILPANPGLAAHCIEVIKDVLDRVDCCCC